MALLLNPPQHSGLIRIKMHTDEIHVWSASIKLRENQLSRLTQFLSPEEWNKASRFRFSEYEDAYKASHSILRIILSKYVQVEPNRLLFVTNAYGKPRLLDELNPGNICFNLSHSHELLVVAITSDCEIGIDIEYMRSLENLEQISSRFFSVEENRHLHRFSGFEMQKAFYTCWTRKEAFMKAKGVGLALGLDRFSVSVVPEVFPIPLVLHWDPLEAPLWSLRDVYIAPEYACCVAVNGKVDRLSHLSFPERLL